MTDNRIEPAIDRRGFLRAAVVTTAAAAATGAGAALLVNDVRPASAPVPSAVVPEPLRLASSVGQDTAEILSQLAASQAENVRLRSQLGILQQQLESARLAGQNDSAVEALRLQLDDANVQMAMLTAQVGALGGLISLYEQLDEIDVAAVAGGGIAALGGVLGDLSVRLPEVSAGIQLGQEAISELEGQIPAVALGWQWLSDQIDKISALHAGVESALRDVVEAAGSILEMLDDWFQDLLKWLPFGIGSKAIGIMRPIAEFFAEIPYTIDGLRLNVNQPLDLWLGKEGEETRLQRGLIRPVREQALNPASEAVTHMEMLQAVYQGQLVEPVDTTNKELNAFRQQILQYRQDHQI